MSVVKACTDRQRSHKSAHQTYGLITATWSSVALLARTRMLNDDSGSSGCLQTIVDDALDISAKAGHKVEHVVVLDHKLAQQRSEVPFTEDRDVWWQDVIDPQPSECPVEWVDAEAPLFKVSFTILPMLFLRHSLSKNYLQCDWSMRLVVS